MPIAFSLITFVLLIKSVITYLEWKHRRDLRKILDKISSPRGSQSNGATTTSQGITEDTDDSTSSTHLNTSPDTLSASVEPRPFIYKVRVSTGQEHSSSQPTQQPIELLHTLPPRDTIFEPINEDRWKTPGGLKYNLDTRTVDTNFHDSAFVAYQRV